MEAVEYTLIRSRRKTVSLQIKGDLQVVVRCPNRMSKARVDAFVALHRDWIEKHTARMAEVLRAKEAFAFAPGQIIYYRGAPCPIGLEADRESACVRDGLFLLPDRAAEDRAAAAEVFLRAEAARLVPPRALAWAERMDLHPAKITVTGARTRWGSCSGQGNLCFSWRTVCLPPELLDYIIVHELSHLVHHNHSSAFHGHVARYLPEERALRRALRAFHGKLTL